MSEHLSLITDVHQGKIHTFNVPGRYITTVFDSAGIVKETVETNTLTQAINAHTAAVNKGEKND